MTKSNIAAILGGAVILAASGAAWAQDPNGGAPVGPQIRGDTDITADVENLTNTAVGNSNATLEVGAITGQSIIDGDTTIDVEASNISNSAEGNSDASTRIGVVNNARIQGDTNIEVRADNVSTRAESNSCASTVIGGITPSGCGQ